MDFFFEPRGAPKLQLASALAKKLKKFQDAFEDYHEIDFFSKNEVYCPYWKTNMFYSPTYFKWTCNNGKSFEQNYKKTNHICIIKPLYEEIKRTPETNGRLLGVEPISISFMLILELIQSSAVFSYIANNTILAKDESFLERLINNDDESQLILGRILKFYDNFVNVQALPKNAVVPAIENKPKNVRDFLMSELPALPSVPKAKNPENDFDDGIYDITENRDTLWHYPWHLIIPPLSWTDKFVSSKYPRLFEWSFLRQTYVQDPMMKDEPTSENIMNKFFPFLEIDLRYIEAVVDQRIIKNDMAKITILFKFL